MDNPITNPWRDLGSSRPASLSALEWQWLSYPDSLTEKFERCYAQKVAFCLLQEGFCTIGADEAQLLGVAGDESHWVRYSEWRCGDQVWMAARTVIPRTCRHPSLFSLAAKPIGKILFASKACRRRERHYASLLPTDPDYLAISSRKLPSCTKVLARRSVFILGEDALLVSEVFFPDFFHAEGVCPI